GWAPTPAAATLFVDYFDHRVGDGSLVAVGATTITRTLDAPLDLSQANEIIIAMKAVPAAPATFFVADGTSTHAFTMTDLYVDDGWRIISATPGAWPAGFASDATVQYGFSGLTAASRYSFDSLRADTPIRGTLLRPELTDCFAATPAAAALTLDDDDRVWRSTSVRATNATQVTYTLPAPRDCSRARALVVAVQRSPAAAPLTVRLLDDATPAATIDLAGTVVTTSGAWELQAFALPQAGIFNWQAVTAIRFRALDATATYVFGPALLEADPSLDLVVMGGDGTSAGAGRFYGDGLAAVKESDETYFTQPDLPEADPTALAPVAAGRRRIDLAYLDLWERPLTYIERPLLRDVALNGDDTCARKQLVAQVRLLIGADVPIGGAATRPDDVFASLARHGNGVLSTKDTPAAALDPCADPCEPAIAGPYLGEDNRLFRVEIHRAGDIGPANAATTAVLKWSRNNGAISSEMTSDEAPGSFSVEVEKPELFSIGDIIELSDDLAELATGSYEDRVTHRRHTRGELRRIVTVNLQTRRLGWQDASIIDPAEVPYHTPLPNAMLQAYHAKATQWDGVAAVTAGDIVVADGVVLEFGGSQMIAGDYWQFATRSLDHSVERLIEAPPRGIDHAYYPLAAIHRARQDDASPEVVFAEDLRPRYAALPSLDASRIAYDPSACIDAQDIAGWDQVTTVQQAIDALCRADLTGDMKLHNKLLHGMGMICGLKLRCAQDRAQVILGKGYALDCEGNLLQTSGARGIPVVEQAKAAGLLDGSSTGDVNMWIEQGAGGVVTQIEPYVAQSFLDSVLEGTLLKDFWDKCVLNLFNFVKKELLPFPCPTLPLTTQHELVISLINLIWQKVNSASGPYIFVSKAEHDLLAQFYQDLRALLASKTFCGMFDGVHPFPAYPYPVPPGIDTMFGMFLMHRRMKRVPGDAYVATYGVGNQIQFFDVVARSAIAVTTFPGATNVDVRDVAFSDDGSEMYAVGTIISGTDVDSLFATATITPPGAPGGAPTIVWGPVTVVCDIEFVTLATHTAQPNRLFGVGRSATDATKRGVYRFTLPTIPLVPAPIVNFNATGLFAIDTNGIDAVATQQSGGLQTGVFDGLRQLNLNTLVTSVPFAVNGTTLYDDVAIANGSVFLTGINAGVATLFRYTLSPAAALPTTVLGPSSSVWRLGHLPSKNVLTIADGNTYRLRLFDTGTATLANNVRIPVQIVPIAAVARSDDRELYVLNMFSGTVNACDVDTLVSGTPSFTAEPPASLATYRAAMLTAFTDLTGVLVQYFKDCFCDKFLIECPTCTPNDKVYLGTISIQKGKVYNICNFSKRHYAKSFRTYGYWLSTIPVLPLVKKAIAKVCCMTLVP
ncbi:MAG: DUF6519 domain-containing protein, partial [Gemmatimonadaceae bacterium]